MAYALVQFKDSAVSGSDVTSQSTGSTTSPCTAGSLLIAVVTWVNRGNPAPTVTLSDTVGTNDTWTQLGSVHSASNDRASVYTLANCAAGTLNLNVGFSNVVGYIVVGVFEFSGIAAYLTHLFATSTTPGNGANAITTGNTGTLASQPALVFGFARQVGGPDTTTLVAGTGYTGLTTVFSAWRPEHKRVTSTAAVAATFTDATNGSGFAWVTFVAAFAEPIASIPGRRIYVLP